MYSTRVRHPGTEVTLEFTVSINKSKRTNVKYDTYCI